jgi:uncharacterized membrane-anchored protein
MAKIDYKSVTTAEFLALYMAKQYWGKTYRSQIQAFWVTKILPKPLERHSRDLMTLQWTRGASWLNSFDFAKCGKERGTLDVIG